MDSPPVLSFFISLLRFTKTDHHILLDRLASFYDLSEQVLPSLYFDPIPLIILIMLLFKSHPLCCCSIFSPSSLPHYYWCLSGLCAWFYPSLCVHFSY